MTLPRGAWTQIEVAGKAVDVYEPTEPSEHNYVVLHLHGHGGRTLKGNEVYTAEFERYGLRAVCPHGARSWWGKRICAEFDPQITPVEFIREQLMPEIRARFSAEPPAVALAGVSMGGQGALRISYWYPREFPIVAALSPAVDFQNWLGMGYPLDEMYESQLDARQETATLQIHPLNWPPQQFIACDPTDPDCFEGTDRLISKLNSSGILFEKDLTTTAGGHSWEYFNHMAAETVKFLYERLERERLKFRD